MRIAAKAYRQVNCCLLVTYPVNIRILRRHFLSEAFDVLSQRCKVSASLGAHLPFESPPSETQEPRLELLTGPRKYRVVQVAHEHIHPKISSLQRRRLCLNVTGWAEVVVGDEFV